MGGFGSLGGPISYPNIPDLVVLIEGREYPVFANSNAEFCRQPLTENEKKEAKISIVGIPCYGHKVDLIDAYLKNRYYGTCLENSPWKQAAYDKWCVHAGIDVPKHIKYQKKAGMIVWAHRDFAHIGKEKNEIVLPPDWWLRLIFPCMY